MRRFIDDDPWSAVILIVLFILIAVGGCQCSINIRSVKADDLPPLLLEYHLPAIYNHPVSIGEPPDPIE